MKRTLFLFLALALVTVTAQAQRAEQVNYRDSLDVSQNTATATSNAAGFESFLYLRDDFKYYMNLSVSVKFTKKTDSLKIQCATTNFGEDTTWTDVYVKRLKTGINTAAGVAVQRDTLITWITDVGFDGGYDHGPYLIDAKYIGRRMRAVSGKLDTGKVYIKQNFKTPM